MNKKFTQLAIGCSLAFCAVSATAFEQKNTSILVALSPDFGVQHLSVEQRKLSYQQKAETLLQQSMINGAGKGLNITKTSNQQLTKHVLQHRLFEWQVATEDMSALLAELNNNPQVAFAEPNFTVYLDEFEKPNDVGFNQLWGLHNTGQTRGRADADIDALEAWTITTGSKDIAVGVIDTGVDYTHPDLIDNMWVNPNEIAGDGIDNDNNGYVDDIYGVNTINDTGDPMDDHSHGTHVAGTIGASANNQIGVVGVNHHTSMIGCKFIKASGGGAIGDAIKCLDYFIDLKLNGTDVRLTNNSWGGGSYSEAMVAALERSEQAGLLFVSSAGNAGSNNDGASHYPSSYEFDSVLAVASTTHTDGKSSFSNYGVTSVDLGAPGSDVYSTMPDNRYASKSGTSMASPHAAGAAALVLASNPGLTHIEVKNILMETGDPLAALDGTTVSGKRINVANAINAAALPTWYLTSTSNSQTVKQGEVAEFSFAVQQINDWQGLIDLSVAGDLVSSISVNPLPEDGQTVISVVTDENTPVGVHQLTLNATANGVTRNQVIEVVVEHANQVTREFSNNNTVDIPDNNSTGIVSEIVVDEDFTLISGTVEVDITHTWRGDLKVSLLHPSGEESVLHNRAGGSSNNLKKTYDLPNLVGQSVGIWGLAVKDLSGRDVGKLNRWSLTLTGTTSDNDPVTPPQAAFFTQVDGLTVNFTDNSQDVGDDIVSWHWDFGDGQTSTEQNPVHQYVGVGEYLVSLTVTDSRGDQDTVSKAVTIGGFVLSEVSQTRLDNGDVQVRFAFDGSDGIFLSFYRDDRYLTSVFNIGEAVDTVSGNVGASYVYKLCDAKGCSNELTVVIEP